MGSVQDLIFKRAKDLARKEAAGIVSGWEAVEDVADAKIKIDPIPYLVLAIVEYLDDTPPKKDK